MQGGLIGRRPVLPPVADEEDVLDQPRALEGVVQVDGHLLEQLRVAQLLHTLQLLGGGAQHGGAGQKVEGGFVPVPRQLWRWAAAAACGWQCRRYQAFDCNLSEFGI